MLEFRKRSTLAVSAEAAQVDLPTGAAGRIGAHACGSGSGRAAVVSSFADVRSPVSDYADIQVHADVVCGRQLQPHDRAASQERLESWAVETAMPVAIPASHTHNRPGALSTRKRKKRISTSILFNLGRFERLRCL
jgi:hypothetical protein